MNEKNLNNLKMLWEKFDNQKVDDKENQNEDHISSVDNYCYKPKSKWVPPDFVKLPIQNYGLKKTVQFSMAYSGEDKKNHNLSRVN